MKKFIVPILAVLAVLSSCEKENNKEEEDIYAKYKAFIEETRTATGPAIIYERNATNEVVDHSLVQWVDLGLPSGKLWANMNVGAENPSDSGWYLAWGETEPKNAYSIENYIYWDGTTYEPGNWPGCTAYGMTKFVGSDFDASADVCTKAYGAGAHTPDYREFRELVNNTTVSIIEQPAVYDGEKLVMSQAQCFVFTSKTDPSKQIIMPCSGQWIGSTFYRAFVNTSGYFANQKAGHYWMNTGQISGEVIPMYDRAYSFELSECTYEQFGLYCLTTYLTDNKYKGFSVRAVKSE